jgi:ferric-dicitrate binding protein FerR (iron transport regulator)
MASQEAAYWYIRYSDEPAMLARDRKLFLSWLKRSPENIAEILHIIEMDGRRLQHPLRDVIKEAEQSNVVAINSRGQVAQHYDYNPSDTVADTVKTKAAAGWAYAAIISVLTIAMLFGFIGIKNSTNGTVTTASSQWQHMTLDDGSTVHLDARTRLKIEFTRERRFVHLYEGQAVFEVAKDPLRPFTVGTHIVDVTAVGTRFGVAINPGVTTTVSEGIVKVTPHGKLDDDQAVQLRAGQELRVFNSNSGREERLFGGGGGIADLSKVEVVRVDAERKLDWANGWLTFQGGETIKDIVAQFNRRNTLQIRIDDDSIAAKRLEVGYYRFRVDNPESFVKVLDSQEGITVIKDRRNVVRLTSE